MIKSCRLHPGYRCSHPKYFLIPRAYAQNWDGIFEFAETVHDIQGNDFIGCRTYPAESGAMVVKLWTPDEEFPHIHSYAPEVDYAGNPI